jgi:hypothetical protein
VSLGHGSSMILVSMLVGNELHWPCKDCQLGSICLILGLDDRSARRRGTARRSGPAGQTGCRSRPCSPGRGVWEAIPARSPARMQTPHRPHPSWPFSVEKTDSILLVDRGARLVFARPSQELGREVAPQPRRRARARRSPPRRRPNVNHPR